MKKVSTNQPCELPTSLADYLQGLLIQANNITEQGIPQLQQQIQVLQEVQKENIGKVKGAVESYCLLNDIDPQTVTLSNDGRTIQIVDATNGKHSGPRHTGKPKGKRAV